MSISFIRIITRKKASGCYLPKSVLQWCLWSPWMRLETEARGGLLSKEPSMMRAPHLQWSHPDRTRKLRHGGCVAQDGSHARLGIGFALTIVVVQWTMFTHRTGFDYYCSCSQTEEHPSALDHLGRTWVSFAIFHIFSKPSFWLSGPNSSMNSKIPLLPQYSLHLLPCHCISLILYQRILGAGISIIM